MIKIGVLGASGRMGRVVIEACAEDKLCELGFAAVRETSSLVGVDAGQLVGTHKLNVDIRCAESLNSSNVDVLVDFTLPDALQANLALASEHDLPIVIGTTGLNSQQLSLIDNAANSIPIVFAANYSVGVNLMLNLVKTAAKTMHQADIEIIEAHHRFKKDAPSGTALAIGNSIADALGRDLNECAVYGRVGETGERDTNTIGFATLRAGDVVGEHTALFAELGERLEITHKASSRLTFAKGALTAAKWLSKQPNGLYTMQDVLGLNV